MSDILGFHRMLFLGILVSFNALIGLGNYYYIMPETTKLQRDVNNTKYKIEQKKAETNQLREEFARLKDQMAKYKILENMGFFNEQDRVVAREAFSKLQKDTGLLLLKYKIDSSHDMGYTKAAEVNHIVISSPVKVSIEAMDDVDVYRFIQMVKEKIPGDIAFKHIEVKRVIDITAPVARKIGSGEPVALVKAVVDFDWRTMAPLSSFENDNMR